MSGRRTGGNPRVPTGPPPPSIMGVGVVPHAVAAVVQDAADSVGSGASAHITADSTSGRVSSGGRNADVTSRAALSSDPGHLTADNILIQQPCIVSSESLSFGRYRRRRRTARRRRCGVADLPAVPHEGGARILAAPSLLCAVACSRPSADVHAPARTVDLTAAEASQSVACRISPWDHNPAPRGVQEGGWLPVPRVCALEGLECGRSACPCLPARFGRPDSLLAAA